MDNLNLKQKQVKYGTELREKFIEICRADLISRVLNKANNNLMLLRKDEITKKHIGKTYYVYNGMQRMPIFIKKKMLGYKIGEFIFSKKIRNMKIRSSSKSKSIKRIKSKKKIKRSRKRRKPNYIKNLKNKLVKLKKVTRILRKYNLKMWKNIHDEYTSLTENFVFN